MKWAEHWSKAEMPMPPLGAVFYLQDKKRGIRQCGTCGAG